MLQQGKGWRSQPTWQTQGMTNLRRSPQNRFQLLAITVSVIADCARESQFSTKKRQQCARRQSAAAQGQGYAITDEGIYKCGRISGAQNVPFYGYWVAKDERPGGE